MKIVNEGYRPDPHELGDVVGEKCVAGGRYKSVIVQNKEGDFAVCLYRVNRAETSARKIHPAVWVRPLGPSMVGSFESAQKVAEEELLTYAK